VALEFQIITCHEFFRLGAHGELDWRRSLSVLSKVAKAFIERGTDLALLDVRDTHNELTDEQFEALALALKGFGFREHHRVAILHKKRPNPRAGLFVLAARDRGFDLAGFDNYEEATEWLSKPEGRDPDFDREVYHGPEDGQKGTEGTEEGGQSGQNP
jgi:hypothetical protein